MTDTVRFVVPGNPQGKGRARSFVYKHGSMAGRIGHYTPEKTRSYEGVIKSLAMDTVGNSPPFAGPVSLQLHAVCAVPASWPAWKRARAIAGTVAPTSKPDADNITKAILDGCNGVLWTDDVQVVEFTIWKRYGEQPRVEVVVVPIDIESAQSASKAWGQKQAA